MEKVISTARISSWRISVRVRDPRLKLTSNKINHKTGRQCDARSALTEALCKLTLSIDDDMSLSKILNALVSANVVLQCCSNL